MPTVKFIEGGEAEAEFEEYNIYEPYDTIVP